MGWWEALRPTCHMAPCIGRHYRCVNMWQRDVEWFVHDEER